MYYEENASSRAGTSLFYLPDWGLLFHCDTIVATHHYQYNNALTIRTFESQLLPCSAIKMSPTSFPGVSSSPAPSTSNNNINDDISNQSKMEEYERRWQERHSEETHKAALAAALARHNEIRERALGVLEIEQLREETEMLRQKRIQTEERVRLETQRAMEQMRIREEENKARQIPQPPPRVPTPPQAASTAAPQPKQQNITPAPTNQQANQPISAASRHSPPNPFQSSQNQPSPLGTSQGTQNQPSTSQPKQPQPTPSNPMQSQAQRAAQQPNQAQRSMQAPPMVPQQPPNPSQVPQAAQASSAQPQVKRLLLHQSVDRYVDIHKTLKSVRKAVKDHGEKDPQFKKKAGDMRRAITRSVGQLTEGKGVNKVPVSRPVSPRPSPSFFFFFFFPLSEVRLTIKPG
jgi:nucleoporin GLE1